MSVSQRLRHRRFIGPLHKDSREPPRTQVGIKYERTVYKDRAGNIKLILGQAFDDAPDRLLIEWISEGDWLLRCKKRPHSQGHTSLCQTPDQPANSIKNPIKTRFYETTSGKKSDVTCNHVPQHVPQSPSDIAVKEHDCRSGNSTCPTLWAPMSEE
jgi:hypothetical protein